MEIIQNTITRNWSVEYKGKTYYVDLTYSDGQTLALLNRNYWEIIDENHEDVCHVLGGEKPKLSDEEVNEIIDFCMDNFFSGRFKEEVMEVSRRV